jgi:hypothetical protein
VGHHRQTLAQVVDEAVKMGVLVGNPVRAVKPLRVTDSGGVAPDREETRALLAGVADHRRGAAVAHRRFVGHAKPTATACHVKGLVQPAAAILDGHAEREDSARQRS